MRKKSNLKGDATLTTIMLTAVIMAGLLLFTIVFGRYQGIPNVDELEKIDRIAFLERSKYAINALGNAEFGEVTETLLKPVEVEVTSETTGNYIKVAGVAETEKVNSEVKPGKVNSYKIKFVKTKGGPVSIQAG